jgi:hypothetical protein
MQSTGTPRDRRKKKSNNNSNMNETTMKSIDQMNSEEKLQRLDELQRKLVGGEDVHNEERTKKRRKKLMEMQDKQEQRYRLANALDVNDDDMMMRVYDNAQEEVRTDFQDELDRHVLPFLASFYNETIRTRTLAS